MPRAAAGAMAPALAELSEEVHKAILLCGAGYEVAALAAVARFVARLLDDDGVWTAFVRQEFRCGAGAQRERVTPAQVHLGACGGRMEGSIDKWLFLVSRFQPQGFPTVFLSRFLRPKGTSML